MGDPIIARATAAPQERRSARRISVLLTAELEFGGTVIAVRLLNLSSLGAMVRCRTPLTHGKRVILRRGELLTPATVAWINDGHMGLKFEEPVSDFQMAAILRPSDERADG